MNCNSNHSVRIDEVFLYGLVNYSFEKNNEIWLDRVELTHTTIIKNASPKRSFPIRQSPLNIQISVNNNTESWILLWHFHRKLINEMNAKPSQYVHELILLIDHNLSFVDLRRQLYTLFPIKIYEYNTKYLHTLTHISINLVNWLEFWLVLWCEH